MPGPIETGGEVARSAIDALKASPAVLALILMQAITIGILAWRASARDQYEEQVNMHFRTIVTECLRSNPNFKHQKRTTEDVQRCVYTGDCAY